MKKFVLNTKSESSDNYTYFIQHPQEPTSDELYLFLKEHGSDLDEEDGESYEHVDSIYEIKDEEFLTIPNK